MNSNDFSLYGFLIYYNVGYIKYRINIFILYLLFATIKFKKQTKRICLLNFKYIKKETTHEIMKIIETLKEVIQSLNVYKKLDFTKTRFYKSEAIPSSPSNFYLNHFKKLVRMTTAKMQERIFIKIYLKQLYFPKWDAEKQCNGSTQSFKCEVRQNLPKKHFYYVNLQKQKCNTFSHIL